MADVVSWLGKILARNAWESSKSEARSLDATPIVIATFEPPAEQKTEGYRVSIVAEETPVNDTRGAWVLFRAYANASGTVSSVFATITDGGGTAGLAVAIERNATTGKIEVLATGAAATIIMWRCARLEAA